MDNLTWLYNDSSLSNQSARTPDGNQIYLMPTLPGWVSTLYFVLLCSTIGLGLPGNLITALAYLCVKTKTSCDWYIFFVALFDLISCLFRITGYLLEFLGLWVKLTNTGYCIFVAWVSQTSVCVSIFIFGLISIERCIKICCVTSLYMTANCSRNICLVLALVTFVMCLPTVFIYTNTPNGICAVPTEFTKITWVKVYYCVIIALFIALTMAVMVCYAAIIWTVRMRRKTVGVISTDRTNTEYSMRNTNQTSPETASNRPRYSDTDNNSQATSSYIPEVCTQAVARTAVSKLVIVPGPQTQVIVQSINMGDRRVVTNPSAHEINTQRTRSEETDTDGPASQPASSPIRQAVTTDSHHMGTQCLNMFSQIQYARRLRRDFKITGLLFLVTIIFIVSWIPPYYATMKAFFIGYTFPISTTELITLKLAPTSFMVNNFSNPIIYLALSSTYRQKVRQLWAKWVRFLKRPC